MAFLPKYEETLSSDDSTEWVSVKGPIWVSLSGTFGGGTAIIQRKNAAGSAVAIVGESHTVAADRVIDFPPHAVNEVRINLSGSSSPSLATMVEWSSPDKVL